MLFILNLSISGEVFLSSTLVSITSNENGEKNFVTFIKQELSIEGIGKCTKNGNLLISLYEFSTTVLRITTKVIASLEGL